MKFIKFYIFIFLFLLSPLAMADEIIDSDGDGLSDTDEETIYFTDSKKIDTDGDGFNDSEEIKNGYSPLFEKKKLKQVDSDSDGLNDDLEIKLSANLKNPDTDNDGYKDGEEVANGFDPSSDDKKQIAKLIKVSLKNQNLEYFFGDKKMDSFKISSGVKRMETPRGEFKVLDKIPTKTYGGKGYNFYYPNTKWNLHFTTQKARFYIHGAYWHNKFGRPMSHGCVNVSYENMENLYNFAQIGTKVIIE